MLVWQTDTEVGVLWSLEELKSITLSSLSCSLWVNQFLTLGNTVLNSGNSLVSIRWKRGSLKLGIIWEQLMVHAVFWKTSESGWMYRRNRIGPRTEPWDRTLGHTKPKLHWVRLNTIHRDYLMTIWQIRLEPVKSTISNAKVMVKTLKKDSVVYGIECSWKIKQGENRNIKPYHCLRPQEGHWVYKGEQFLYCDQSRRQIENRSRDDFCSDVQSAVKGQFSPGLSSVTLL